jgi:hypothetical protein
MKKSPDTTLAVLKDIRGEVRSTNGRIDVVTDRPDALREELSRRIVESEVRTSTALTDLAGTVGELSAHLEGQHDLRPRVERREAGHRGAQGAPAARVLTAPLRVGIARRPRAGTRLPLANPPG